MNAIALSDATAGSRYCICEIKEENRLVNRLSSMVCSAAVPLRCVRIIKNSQF